MSVAAFCLWFVTACGDSGSGIRRSDGCLEHVITEPSIASDAGSAGNPRAAIDALNGTWADGTGDVFSIMVSDAVTIHDVYGTPSAANASFSCASQSYTGTPAHVTLSSADGRLDESMDVDLHIGTAVATFNAKLRPSDLHGTLMNAPPFPLSSVSIEGSFELAPTSAAPMEWFVSVMMNGVPLPDDYDNRVTVSLSRNVPLGAFGTRQNAP